MMCKTEDNTFASDIIVWNFTKGCRCRGIQSRKAEDMKVLIDTNIIIDVLTLWDFYKEHIEK